MKNSLSIFFGTSVLATGISLAISALFSSAEAASITNGGFESGFTGWSTVVQSGSSGNLFTTDSSSAPLSGNPIPGGGDGSQIAVTDQNGPGSYVLFQDIALEAEQTHSLTFDWFAQSNAAFANAGTMDFNVSPNQHFRVDIVNSSFNNWFTGSSSNGVLTNLIAPTIDSTIPSSGFNNSIFNLTPFAGSTVRLAFREVDNRGFFQMGVDNVSISSTPVSEPIPEPIPEPGSILGMGAVLGFGGFLRNKSAKQQKTNKAEV